MRRILIFKGLWFYFFFTALLLLVAIRYLKYMPENLDILSIIYLLAATLSHFICLSFVLFVLYIPIPLILPKKWLASLWATVVGIVGLLLLFIDTFVYDFYRMHINRFVLELIFGGNATQIFEFHTAQYLMALGSIVILLSVVGFFSWKFFYSNSLRIKVNGWLMVCITILMLIFTHFTHAWADVTGNTTITKSSRFYPLFFPTTARKLFYKMGYEEAAIEIHSREITKEDALLNYPINKMKTGLSADMNIILIMIDSWYYKALDSITMPNIYDFSKESEFYSNHYSGSNGTRTGVFSLFYGLPGTFWYSFLSGETSPVLVDVLMEKNYQIKTFTSASLINPPFHKTILKKIPDIYYPTKGNKSFDRDIQLTHNWLEYISNNPKEPFFSWLFFDAPHSITHPPDYPGPFQPEWDYPKYELLHNDLDPTPFLNLYKNSTHFVDSLVGVILTDLENRDLLDNSWVIITGDHGQEFNDNRKNYWGHNGNYSPAQMKVPLIIHKPNQKPLIHNHWTSHYDIVPTIMQDLFDCKNQPYEYSVGNHLKDSTNRNWLLVGSADNFAILGKDRIYSVYFNGTFDITDTELNPVISEKLPYDKINQIILNNNRFFRK